MILHLKDLNHLAKLVGFDCDVRIVMDKNGQNEVLATKVELYVRHKGRGYHFNRCFYGYNIFGMPDEAIKKMLEQDALKFREDIIKQDEEVE